MGLKHERDFSTVRRALQEKIGMRKKRRKMEEKSMKIPISCS
jgi:hypothetical protein